MGFGMASVNQTQPHCVNQMGKTHSKPLATRHGRGTARARHAVCESAFTAYRLLRGTIYVPLVIISNFYRNVSNFGVCI